MKRKVLLGVALFSLLFLIGGIYIVFSIERGVTTLSNIIKLHRVEILREHLLIDLKRVQADIHFKNTRYARGATIMVAHARAMDAAMEDCFGCHHSDEITTILTDLKKGIEQYKDAISRVLTIRADVARLEVEEDAAFQVGEQLVEKVAAMIEIANEKLAEKTRMTLRQIDFSKKILFFLLATGPIVALILGILFTRSVTRPIDALLEATRRVKEADLSYRITEPLQDEFAELATSFNEMTSSINRQYREMQRAEQLTVYGEMAAGLAHEIKTPLAGIKGAMKLLESDVSEENRNVLGKAVDEIKRIESLMKELLQYARPSKPHLMRIDVNELLQKVIDLLPRYPSFHENSQKKIKIVTEFAQDMPPLETDPLQQQQIFLNLLLNAADAMPTGGTLTVRTSYSSREKWAEVVVADTGHGIPEKLMANLFKPFFTTKPKGTGLGLATTKRLVEQHGGSITASNQKVGASFCVRFPVEQKTGEEAV